MKYLCAVLVSLISIYGVADGFFVAGIDNTNPLQMGLDLIGMGREIANRLGIRFQNRQVQYGPKIEPFFKTMTYQGSRANGNWPNEFKRTIGDFNVRPSFLFGKSASVPKVYFRKNIAASTSQNKNLGTNYYDKYYKKGYGPGKAFNFKMGPLRFRVQKYFGFGMPAARY